MRHHTLFSIIAIILIFAISGCEQNRTPTRYIIPKGFNGWAIIFWNQPGSKESLVDNNFIIAEFPHNGIILSSSTLLDGWGTETYYWRMKDGTIQQFGKTGNVLINGEGNGSSFQGDNLITEYSYFYVGSDYTPNMTADKSIANAIKLYQIKSANKSQ